MSFITWHTPAGYIGSIAQGGYFELDLSATDSNNSSLEFTKIAGTLPLGLEVNRNGRIQGVPVIASTETEQSKTSIFTVRANTASGVISDRSFRITINNFNPIRISLASKVIGTFLDGSKMSYQFTAVTDNPNPTLTWSIVDGQTPDDMVSKLPIQISPSGLMTGYISRTVENTSSATGYDVAKGDAVPYDFLPKIRDRSYSFTVQVTDGVSFDVVPLKMKVISRDRFTTDNISITVDTDAISINAINVYVPIITTDATNIPVLAVGDKFSFKFNAVDPTDAVIAWRASPSLSAAGLSISSSTGWITGTVSPQSEFEKKHVIRITAYNSSIPTRTSPSLEFILTTVNDRANYITWQTPSDLGSVLNGSVSELIVEASTMNSKALTYELGPNSQLPTGYSLLPTGEIVGKCSFKYFSIDGAKSNITVASVNGISPGMTVEGPGVASGCTVINVLGPNTVEIQPATYINEGATITFANLISGMHVTTQLTDLSTTTTIDGGKTSFDDTYSFTVVATTESGESSSARTFALRVVNYNRAPYEDVYLSALLSRDQRNTFSNIMSTESIFPPEFIYRPNDPNFGLAKSIKVLFLPGLTASTLHDFAASILKNHYNKTIKFGNVRTARALDANFNVKYEVVYLEVDDNNAGASLAETPVVSHPYNYDGVEYTTLYPNSYANMKYRLSSGVGFANRGALPDWMTSRQENKVELGLVRAIVLAYTLPGHSDLIAFRLSAAIQHGTVSFADIHFVADRYYLASSSSADYDPTTNSFLAEPVDATDKYIKFNQVGVYR